jgi:hypothetical protein
MSSLLLICSGISVCCSVLSLITTGHHSIVSLWLFWLWLVGFATVNSMSEPEGPTFSADLTGVGSLW